MQIIAAHLNGNLGVLMASSKTSRVLARRTGTDGTEGELIGLSSFVFIFDSVLYTLDSRAVLTLAY